MSNKVYASIEPVTTDNVLFALKWMIIYFAYMIFATKILPSKTHQIKIKQHVKIYKNINGLQLFIVTCLLALLLIRLNILSLIPLIKKFWSFFIAANIISVVFAVYLYVRCKLYTTVETDPVRLDYLPGFVWDFWLGIERNPEMFGKMDLKMFFYQPSLIGLYMFAIAFAEYQYVQYNFISIEMYLLLAFWWFYLYTHYIKEEFMLYTWDIIAENFGLMLIWGDTVYLPFLYSICGWYAVETGNNLSIIEYTLIVVFYIISIYIFRVSNAQKHQFKLKLADSRSWLYWWNRDIQVLDEKILISGFWGIGRHLNYTGEILTYLSISLTTGFQSFVPYLLPFSLLLLLTHRAWRDEQRCKEKYGQLWVKYCKIAKFRVIPFIY